MSFLLLVEGSDDLHLIKNVAREHGPEIDPKTARICEGIERLLHEVLPTALKSSVDVVAVVVDADLDVAARWQAVRHQLSVAGYTAPVHPEPAGLVLTERRPAVGIWLMPDNSIPGTLEDFATQLIAPEDPLWVRASRAVADIPERERRFAAGTTRKAEIHTWLAWQEEPGTPLGLAVTKKYFQTDGDLCARFTRWLRQLQDLTSH